MRESFYSLYLWLRRRVEGLGLSRHRVLRNLNIRLDRFLRGRRREMVEVRGLKVHLDPRETVRHGQEHEPFSTRLVERYLNPGGIFVDVGANLGWFSLVASRCVGREGKVYAFEPNVDAFKLLKRNSAENGCMNIIAEHKAVAEKSGELSLYVIGDLWTGSTTFDPRSDRKTFIDAHFMDGEDKTVREYRVPAVSLDSYFKNQKVDFVKIDAEGSEYGVFLGMKDVIRANPGIRVLMEWNPTALRGAGTNPPDLMNEIRSLKFLIYVIDERKAALKLLPPGQLPPSGVNILLTRSVIDFK